MIFSTEQTITIAIVVVVLIVIIGGAVYVYKQQSRMSQTDQVVYGCWRGKETTTKGSAVGTSYLFWSGGKYSIVGTSFAFPLFERGIYKTEQAQDGSVTLTLTPDTTTKYTEQFSTFGTTRALKVESLKTNAGTGLTFDGGEPFMKDSCDQYTPLT